MNNCVKCGNPITATKEKGRKKVYCSIACRRSAELEIRRINERLTGLEKIAERLRLGDVMLKMFHTIESIQEEINIQENRLKTLLNEE